MYVSWQLDTCSSLTCMLTLWNCLHFSLQHRLGIDWAEHRLSTELPLAPNSIYHLLLAPTLAPLQPYRVQLCAGVQQSLQRCQYRIVQSTQHQACTKCISQATQISSMKIHNCWMVKTFLFWKYANENRLFVITHRGVESMFEQQKRSERTSHMRCPEMTSNRGEVKWSCTRFT